MFASVTRCCAVIAVAMLTASSAAQAQRVRFAGSVRDLSTGQGVTGAIVEIASADKRYAARTDEMGEFFIADVDVGTYRTLVKRIGYSPMARDLDITAGIKPVTLRIAPIPQALGEVRVRGQGTGIWGMIARSGDMSPIVNAEVYVAGSRDSAYTDSTGAYFLALKRPGTFMVRARAPGYVDQMFVVEVKRNQVADGSSLLDVGDAKSIPRILWMDFDQRLNWATVNKSALLTGSEMRRQGGDVTRALKLSGTMVSRGMRLGPTVCMYVNGQPRPGMPVDAIRPEEITAMEVYGSGSDSAMLLKTTWPPNLKCSGTGERPQRGAVEISAIVIWTR